MINIFIGYDTRTPIAYHVCVNSIIRHATKPISITPLSLINLSDYTEQHTDGSNQFIYSRFLVPYLMKYSGWAIFMDGDMLVRNDINKLWELRDESKAVQVIKHSYSTRLSEKYLGAHNENYPRKNWSSVIIWNCSHPSNAVMTPKFIQESTGQVLHRFSWLKEEEIGELPISWNWLSDEFGPNADANLIHYTLGTPCFFDFSTTPMADEWHREKLYTEYALQRSSHK